MTNQIDPDQPLSEDALTNLAIGCLRKLGVPKKSAAQCARVLVLADMMGIHTHGVMRVLSYGERLSIGGIDATAIPQPEMLASALGRVSGRNALGPVVGMTALDAAMTAARTTGIAAVFCNGSNHFGPIAPYALIAAEAGFASIIASNATTTIAPTGGTEARLGNNPIGFGFPNPGGRPVLLDMAISVVARAKIRTALKEGRAIPQDWATDAEGRPTTDPAEALKGFLLPIGGYKGYGLSLAVDMLVGVLSGAAYLTHVSSWVDAPEAPQDLGHAFILIDSARLGPTDWLADRMRDAGRILRDTPPADPDRPVLLPGDRELDRLDAARANGVIMAPDVLREMGALLGAAGS